jgi:hypothetical protein
MSPNKPKKRFGERDKELTKTKEPEKKKVYIPSIN